MPKGSERLVFFDVPLVGSSLSMRNSSQLAPVALAAGCALLSMAGGCEGPSGFGQTDGSDVADSDDAGLSPETVHPCAAGSGFSMTPTSVKLPFAAPQVSDAGAQSSWQLRRVDADARPDLLRLGDGSGAFTGNLEVWRGTGEGFAAAAAVWSLPDPRASLPGISIVENDADWALVDLDGDDHLDVAVAAGAEPVGSTTWQVYRGSEGTLTSLPVGWSIPFATGPRFSDPGNAPSWALLDLDGNGQLDMVARSGAHGDGVATWSWWPGSTVGFSAFERAWRIPQALGSVVDRSDSPVFSVGDFDGDLTADLLIADPHGDDALSLHTGGLGGFAASVITLPFPWEVSAVADQSEAPTWTLVDVDGDRRMDLVTTRADPREGAPVNTSGDGPAWWVYFGVADDTTAARITLSESPVAWSTPMELSTVRDGGTLETWKVIDFDGDGVVDLVLASEQDPETWQVYFGRCR